MEKYFNWYALITAVAGGLYSSVHTFSATLMQVLLGLCVLDYITGICKAIVQRRLNSEIGFKGILMKLMYFILIASAGLLLQVINTNIPLCEVTALFFISNEFISILENAGEFIPVPTALRDSILSLRSKN